MKNMIKKILKDATKQFVKIYGNENFYWFY